jgi:hypothetical protein
MVWFVVIAALTSLPILMLVTRRRKVRFRFEDREDHVVLGVEGRLEDDDHGLMTMKFLREALRLKLVSDYRRLLVQARGVSLADESAFWLLVAGLGPLLLTDSMKVAVVCGAKSDLGKRLVSHDITTTFGSPSEALTYLRSAEPAHASTLDPDWVESLLLSRKRSAPPLRKAA